MAASSRRVVLTGMSTLTPIGLDPQSLWQSLLAGKSGVRPIRTFDPSALPTRIAAEIDGFEAKTYITDKNQRRSLKMMSRPIQMAVSAAQVALSKVDRSKIDSTRFG